MRNWVIRKNIFVVTSSALFFHLDTSSVSEWRRVFAKDLKLAEFDSICWLYLRNSKTDALILGKLLPQKQFTFFHTILRLRMWIQLLSFAPEEASWFLRIELLRSPSPEELPEWAQQHGHGKNLEPKLSREMIKRYSVHKSTMFLGNSVDLELNRLHWTQSNYKNILLFSQIHDKTSRFFASIDPPSQFFQCSTEFSMAKTQKISKMEFITMSLVRCRCENY